RSGNGDDPTGAGLLRIAEICHVEIPVGTEAQSPRREEPAVDQRDRRTTPCGHLVEGAAPTGAAGYEQPAVRRELDIGAAARHLIGVELENGRLVRGAGDRGGHNECRGDGDREAVQEGSRCAWCRVHEPLDCPRRPTSSKPPNQTASPTRRMRL